MHHYLFAILAGFLGASLSGLYFRHRRLHEEEYAKLIDLQDAPFKFKIVAQEHNDYAVFDLGNGTTLWCSYTFGIKSDGVYGINNLKLHGLNSERGGTIKLNIGQSIFPIIQSIDAFDTWVETKAFDCAWEHNFKDAWDEMKKKLDNLRILETKSKEKEKKPK